ncbi:MAG TPA: manganese efflux pump, partial [Clostridia bacterium]|nr:manganese efflux pump [Clostridia bacterium]
MAVNWSISVSLLELALIAIALSMDAFAVSITEGVRMPTLKYSHALKIAFFFGLFQAFMPILGYMAGASVHVFIESIDHWV